MSISTSPVSNEPAPFAIVVGNGPSAKLLDFDHLRRNGIASVGMNAAYRYWDKIDFRPTHYMCMDIVVIKSHAKRIAELINEGRIRKFFLRNEFLESYPEFTNHKRIVWFDELHNKKGSLFDTDWITTGSWAIRWMAHEGMRIIAVIGIDVNYVEILPEAQRLGSDGDLRLELTSTPRFNPNYFISDYQQAGDQYNIPNDPMYQLETGGLVHIDALREARNDIERTGLRTRIFDCSPISSHGVFKKTDLARLLVGCQIALATSFYCSVPLDELENNFRIAVGNARNPGIASVTILLEGELEKALQRIDPVLSDEIQENVRGHRIRVIPIDARPSYLELFNAARAQGVELCAVANSDILLNEDFTSKFITDYTESPRPFVVLTRWNKTANGNFLQGQVAHPPWQEIPVEEITHLQTNYLSFDTYIFDRRCPLPPDLTYIRIGTFGCDTAIAGLMRVAGQAVVNPCLSYVSLHVDEKIRNYKDAIGDEQMMFSTQTVKNALLRHYSHLSILQTSLHALEELPPSLASIGAPMHSRGRWHSVFRLLGYSPWTEKLIPVAFKEVKFTLQVNEVADRVDEIIAEFNAAMDDAAFIEIELHGRNGDNFLECFWEDLRLREVRQRLFRYDRQSCICVDMVSEDVRRVHSDLVLIVRQQLSLLNSSMDVSPGAASMVTYEEGAMQGSLPDKQSRSSQYPRLLIVDPTYVGHSSATGHVKKRFLGDWPSDRVMQIWQCGGVEGKIKILPYLGAHESVEYRDDEQLLAACQAFKPDVIYLRPVDSPRLLELSERLVRGLAKPMILHMMDDWPERLRITDVTRHNQLDASLIRLLEQATLRLSICEAMSHVYHKRYGGEWFPLANGVDVREFPQKMWADRLPVSQQHPFIIRYMGALADDMTFTSVSEIAQAVSRLNVSCSVRFEIYTMEWCRSKAESELGNLSGVTVHPLVSEDCYKQSLSGADALVIAYNFDPKSIAYIGLSLANKMPECLASGVPLIAYGPSEVATIRYLKDAGCAQVIDCRDQDRLTDSIKALIADLSLCQRLGDIGRIYASEKLSLKSVQDKFRKYLTRLIAAPVLKTEFVLGPFMREQHAHYDETDCIAELYIDVLQGHTMIDVGAHHGWAHAPFLDRGWQIFAFEPDNQNREKLLERLAKHKNKHLVSLDTRCVSNNSKKGVSFFTSEQSTGISGLSAFHETHQESQKVDITTLTDFFQDKPMPAVDFLKIDTEGHDLFVLQGYPWEKGKPVVIECEFEDTKTVPLGYTFQDLARYLVDKGYTVYVSEWHPIIRYGIRHDWRQLTRYPCELADPKGWGNLLAFRDPIDEQALVTAVKRVLKVGGGETEQKSATLPKPDGAVKPIVAKPVSAANHGFRFVPGPHFAAIAPNQWRYTDTKAEHKFWVAAVDAPGPTAGHTFDGTLRVMADRVMSVAISLGRHGKSEYEGARTCVTLAPGVAQTVKLSKQFELAHQALKLQVEALELPGSGTAVLTIDGLGVAESKTSDVAGDDNVKSHDMLPNPAAVIPPVKALPVSISNRYFDIDPGPHFDAIAPNQWRYTDGKGKHKFWVAAVSAPGPTEGHTFVGTLRVMADRAMTVAISFGRHGTLEYEGARTNVTLAPGIVQTVKLSKQFMLPHQALKLQVEVLELPGSSTAVLTIDDLGVAESMTSALGRVGDAHHNLRSANRLFREKDYFAALAINLCLSRKNQLPMYGDNAVRAANYAGMLWVKQASDLAWVE